MRYSKEKIKELTGIEIDSDYGFIEVVDEKKYKTNKQNKAFHGLLRIFWDSGCSSFLTYNDLRWHYKWIASLVEIMYISELDDWTKECVWKAIKVLPLKEEQRKAVIELLRGRVLKEHSWGEANRENATQALNQLINDMCEAGVSTSKVGKKFENALKDMSKGWYETN